MKKAKGREFTPAEVALLFGGPMKGTGGPIVRCYYCSGQGTSYTAGERDEKPLSRWVCPDHLLHQPQRLTMSGRLRHFVLIPALRRSGRARLLQRR
jgi:hypothetical protein